VEPADFAELVQHASPLYKEGARLRQGYGGQATGPGGRRDRDALPAAVAIAGGGT